MGSMSGDPQQPHAVLVPGPGLGHINGMLLLAKALASVGITVTLACFERSYQTHASKGRLPKILSHLDRARIELVADGLPPAASSFKDLFQISPAMRHNLAHLLRCLAAQRRGATCLVSDTIMAWTQDVAEELGIPRVEYVTASASSFLTVRALPQLIAQGYAGCHSGEVPRSWRTKEPIFLDCVRGYPSFTLDEVPLEFRYTTMDDPVLQRFLQAATLANKANCLLIHTMRKLEEKAFRAFEHGPHIATYAIGPLIQEPSGMMSSDTTLMWLNAQVTSSVIYVSFGSNIVQTEDEIMELAHGLEASGKPFLWVIRTDALTHGGTVQDNLFPPNFRDRIADKGLIVPWVSQLDVLAHPALAGFVTHCGWNSTLESLWMGVPLLTCPKRADQPFNNKLIVKDWGVGIEIKTSFEESIPSRHDIEAGIRVLMDEPIGHIVRARALEMKTKLRGAAMEGGESHADLLNFASRMKLLHRRLDLEEGQASLVSDKLRF